MNTVVRRAQIARARAADQRVLVTDERTSDPLCEAAGRGVPAW